MTNEEFEIEQQEQNNDSDELTLDDLNSGWISNPKVGEEITIVVNKIKKLSGTALVGKTSDGKTFKKNLSNVDFTYEIETMEGPKYTISSWEVFGKIKSILNKLKQIQGVELNIKHIKDGMKDKEGDSYEVAAKVNGVFRILDRKSKEWV